MVPLQIIGTEWIFIVLVVLVLVFGTKKIPELAKSFGKAMGEFQKARIEMEKEMKAVTQAIQAPITETTQAIKETIQAPITETTQAVNTSLAAERQPSSSASTVVQPPASPFPEERSKLEKAAHDLGIITEGKTNEQLREEIRKAVS
jgi:sec-independent protein translocase protein TatA